MIRFFYIGRSILIGALFLAVSPSAGAKHFQRGSKLDLHTTPVEQLRRLPGINKVLAEAIGRFRSWKGRGFTSLDQLTMVEGITPNLVNRLRPYVVLAPEGQPIRRTFFIEGSAGNYSGENNIDLYLTEYGLGRPKLKKLIAEDKVSKRRFIEIEDPLIAPGRGSGSLRIAEQDFRIGYAWLGSGNSYTVRLEPADGKPYKPILKALFEGIIRDENDGQLEKTWTVPRAEYLKTQFNVNNNSLRTLRRVLMKRNSELIEKLRKIDAQMGTDVYKDLSAKKMMEDTIKSLKYKRKVTKTRRNPLKQIRPEEF